jgi:hypothetical protein
MYTEKQLEHLVAGAFKCSPKEPAFYGAANGTFLNTRQYAKLSDKEKADYKEFKNPKLEKPADGDVADAKAEAAEKAKADKEAAAAKAKAEKEAQAAAKAEAAAKAKAEKEAAKAGKE